MVLHMHRWHHHRATIHYLKLLGPYMFWGSDIFLDFKKAIWYTNLYLEHPPGESEAAPCNQIH